MTSTPEERDPEFNELARELRQELGDEFRREAEEVERLSELQRVRRRSLSESAAELMARGDVIQVDAAGATFKGQITASHGDLLSLDAGELEIDVNLGSAVSFVVIERRRQGGLEPATGSRSFRARLAEFEQSGEELTLVLSPSSDHLSGRIKVVASDHAVVEDGVGRDRYLPLGGIAAVVRERRSTRRPAPRDGL